MACHEPVSAWLFNCPEGRSVSFRVPKSGDSSFEPVSLPCGKCLGCLADRAMAWSIRAYLESTMWRRNSFITLTYDDDHLPPDNKISKKSLQDFFKRVRKKYTVRYLACGEYGSRTRRPHYHALIFGHDFRCPDEYVVNANGDLCSPDLEQFWKLGQSLVTPLSLGTCMYVCGYVQKKVGDPDSFPLFSKNPPIGKPWFDEHYENVYRLGFVTIEGKKFPLPPQFFEWDNSSHMDILKFDRMSRARERAALLTPSNLRARAIIAKSRFKNRNEVL